MSEPTGQARATLQTGDTEFTPRDAALLRAIAHTGSVASAAATLSRSRARALSRIERLEGSFGDLVERHRGGSGGGGSQLTDAGERLLTRYDRLAAALAATARVPETVFAGVTERIEGELAAVKTPLGTMWGLHDGACVGESTQVRIDADAVTVEPATADDEPTETSARNRHRGRVLAVDRGETVHTVRARVDGESVVALITDESANRLAIRPDATVWLSWKATATQVIGDATAGDGAAAASEEP